MNTFIRFSLSLATVAGTARCSPPTPATTDASAPAVTASAPRNDAPRAPVEDAGGGTDAGDGDGGGLGLTGLGESGGMRSGIGLGSLGLPSPVSSAGLPPTRVRLGSPSVSGRLPPEVIARIVSQGLTSYRACYDEALHRHPELHGQLRIRFVIGRDGTVNTAAADASASDLPDPAVVACVVKTISALKFPSPEGGIVLVGYPFVFVAPDASPASAPATKP